MAAADDRAGLVGAPFVLGARLDVFEDRPPHLCILAGSRRDPLTPYVYATAYGHPQPGGQVNRRAGVVLPSEAVPHANAVVIEFEDAQDVDDLMELLTQVRARLAETAPQDHVPAGARSR